MGEQNRGFGEGPSAPRAGWRQSRLDNAFVEFERSA
jgi:hypothetical protein